MDFEYRIVRHIGVISARISDGKTYRKELNSVSWNQRSPRLDIREWDESHATMSKGITMTRDEARALYQLLQGIFKNDKEA